MFIPISAVLFFTETVFWWFWFWSWRCWSWSQSWSWVCFLLRMYRKLTVLNWMVTLPMASHDRMMSHNAAYSYIIRRLPACIKGVYGCYGTWQFMKLRFFGENVLKLIDLQLYSLYSVCYSASSVQCILCLCEVYFCPNSFRCADDKCIHYGLKCDDVNNCVDNSDEDDCG